MRRKDAKASPPAIWCRDPGVAADGMRAVYRADGATDSYLLALGDAGRGLWVGTDGLGALVAKKQEPRFNLSFVNMRRTFFFPAQDRLPDPAQALEIAQSGQVLSSVTTWGKGSNITIDSSALQK